MVGPQNGTAVLKWLTSVRTAAHRSRTVAKDLISKALGTDGAVRYGFQNFGNHTVRCGADLNLGEYYTERSDLRVSGVYPAADEGRQMTR